MVISNALAAVAENLQTLSLTMPSQWDARESILEMKNAGYRQWRQMEWMGWYFQFLCERAYADILEIPGKKYGNTQFDGNGVICWDFKAHATNTKSGKTRTHVPTNASTAIGNAIAEYGHYGLILAIGNVEYNDEERTFKQWHDALKGGTSAYELDRIERKAESRWRKTGFELSKIQFICFDTADLSKCGGSFQEGFRNADGKPRRRKILINVEKIPDDAMIATVNY